MERLFSIFGAPFLILAIMCLLVLHDRIVVKRQKREKTTSGHRKYESSPKTIALQHIQALDDSVSFPRIFQETRHLWAISVPASVYDTAVAKFKSHSIAEQWLTSPCEGEGTTPAEVCGVENGEHLVLEMLAKTADKPSVVIKDSSSQ